jgi:hypothetical protein
MNDPQLLVLVVVGHLGLRALQVVLVPCKDEDPSVGRSSARAGEGGGQPGGDFGDVGAVAGLPVGVDRTTPRLLRQRLQRAEIALERRTQKDDSAIQPPSRCPHHDKRLCPT